MKKDYNFKSRVHHLVIYPQEDETHKKALEKIQRNYSHAFICHDFDTYDDDVVDDAGVIVHKKGELKKAHTHVIVQLPHARYRNAFCKNIDILPNYDLNDTLHHGLLYLIHYEDINKYQYNLDEVQGNLKQWIVEFLNKKYNTDEQNMYDLLLYIDSQKYITYTNLMKWACKNGYWSTLRRGGNFVCKYIDEHNTIINTYKLNMREVNKDAEERIRKLFEDENIEIKIL